MKNRLGHIILLSGFLMATTICIALAGGNQLSPEEMIATTGGYGYSCQALVYCYSPFCEFILERNKCIQDELYSGYPVCASAPSGTCSMDETCYCDWDYCDKDEGNCKGTEQTDCTCDYEWEEHSCCQ